jgi:hypothetical protein
MIKRAMTGADEKEFPMQRTFTTVSELGKGRYQERYQVILEWLSQ